MIHIEDEEKMRKRKTAKNIVKYEYIHDATEAAMKQITVYTKYQKKTKTE